MTKKELKEKIKNLKKNFLKDLSKEIQKAMNTGAIDIKNFENNYRLPRIILLTAIINAENNFLISKEDKKKINNLLKF